MKLISLHPVNLNCFTFEVRLPSLAFGCAHVSILGSNERDTRAVQVPCACGSLNSSDCFVLTYENEKKQYIWFGKGATFVEREFSKKAATFLASQATFPANEWILAEMDEGNEFDDFWDLLGGKGEYLNPPELQDVSHHLPSPSRVLIFFRTSENPVSSTARMPQVSSKLKRLSISVKRI